MTDNIDYNQDTWDIIKAFLSQYKGKELIRHHIDTFNDISTKLSKLLNFIDEITSKETIHNCNNTVINSLFNSADSNFLLIFIFYIIIQTILNIEDDDIPSFQLSGEDDDVDDPLSSSDDDRTRSRPYFKMSSSRRRSRGFRGWSRLGIILLLLTKMSPKKNLNYGNGVWE